MKNRKSNISRLEEVLDNQYEYATHFEYVKEGYMAPAWASYEGMLRTIELLGMYWERNENGEHKVFGD